MQDETRVEVQGEASELERELWVTFDRIETVTGDFMQDEGEPIWRIEIDGYCAGFDYSEAANNVANAINARITRALSLPHHADREAIARGISAEALATAMNPALFDVDHCLAHMAASPLTIEAARRHAISVADEMRERLLLALPTPSAGRDGSGA